MSSTQMGWLKSNRSWANHALLQPLKLIDLGSVVRDRLQSHVRPQTALRSEVHRDSWDAQLHFWCLCSPTPVVQSVNREINRFLVQLEPVVLTLCCFRLSKGRRRWLERPSLCCQGGTPSGALGQQQFVLAPFPRLTRISNQFVVLVFENHLRFNG